PGVRASRGRRARSPSSSRRRACSNPTSQVMKARHLRFAPTLPLLLLAACSGGGGGGGSPAPQQEARADVVLGAATPFPDLMGLSAEVESIRLRRDDGTLTDNFLSGPVHVDFVGLGANHALVARADIEPVAYTGMQVDFVPGSYRALATDGTTVT